MLKAIEDTDEQYQIRIVLYGNTIPNASIVLVLAVFLKLSNIENIIFKIFKINGKIL